MMWIAASIPFWLVAVVGGFLGAAGVFNYFIVEWRNPGKADTEILWGGMALLIGSGMSAIFAAWVCS